MTTNNIPPQLKRMVRLTETHCFRCGQPIDWSIPYWVAEVGGDTNPDAGTVEHKIPRSKAPHLARDPGNCGASHAKCNSHAGDRDPLPSLGVFNVEW